MSGAPYKLLQITPLRDISINSSSFRCIQPHLTGTSCYERRKFIIKLLS